MTFNLDFHYDFYTQSALFFWLGSGLGILYTDPGEGIDSDVDLAANLIAGLGINTISGLTPYIQGKYINSDAGEFVVGVGLRF